MSDFDKKKAKTVARVWRWVNVAVGYMADQGDIKGGDALENAVDDLVKLEKPESKETEFKPMRLEPRKIFDKAIVGYTADNWAVYDGDKLVSAVKKAYGIRKTSEAIEYVDYNISGSFDGKGLWVSLSTEQE
jgi:hypothetical protein